MKELIAKQIVPRIHIAAVIVFLAVLAAVVPQWVSLPDLPPSPKPAEPDFGWPIVTMPREEHWEVVHRAQNQPIASRGPLGQRLRLAGTFFTFGQETPGGDAAGQCRAIIDDLQKKEQYLAAEGEVFDQVEVVRIFNDHVVLRSQGRDEELWLSFSGDPSSSAAATTQAQAPSSSEEAPALEVNRFGKRIAETRWVLKRSELMNYYREVMDDPERLAAVFVSMKPDYGEQGRIAGYALDPVGEGDFFSAVGLQTGDVVRRVNSMKMTSQPRAEYFIGEFVNNRLNAVVLDIERNGESQKLIYMIR